MSLLRRNKNVDSTGMPEEVSSYYQAESRDRTWMAWLLALVTLAVTALVIIALFFGGRWAYRKIRHNPATTTSVVTQKPAEPTRSNNNSATPPPPTATPTPSTAAGTATPPPSSSSGSVNAPANPSTTSNTSTPATSTPATASTPSVAAANTNLPNTGPGNTIAIFFTVSLFAYLAHRKFSSQR